MLSREENELLCRVGADQPMGKVMRRYWLPALLSTDLPAGADPRRVRLLGEDLVAFRDASGTVGLVDENCPHRGASLALARVEPCGLRCLYHGWVIAPDGRVLETPPEPDEYSFKDRVRAPAYRVREGGGIIWAYMGPPELEPPLSTFEFCSLPAENVHVLRALVECNWAQVIEGVIDSAHSNYLHSEAIVPAANIALSMDRGIGIDRPSNDGKPRIEALNASYGFRYAATRKPLVNADTTKFVRMTLFIAPFYSMFPAPKGWGYLQGMVPIDDEHTIFTFVKYRYDKPISAEERAQAEAFHGFRPGVDILDPLTFRKVQVRENNWLQDREAMRKGSFTGITGVNTQDIAVEESMGAIYDRTKEHLGASDVAVIRMRRLMIDSARALVERGEPPIGLREPVDYLRLRAEEAMLPLDAPWEQLSDHAPAAAS